MVSAEKPNVLESLSKIETIHGIRPVPNKKVPVGEILLKIANFKWCISMYNILHDISMAIVYDYLCHTNELIGRAPKNEQLQIHRRRIRADQ